MSSHYFDHPRRQSRQAEPTRISRCFDHRDRLDPPPVRQVEFGRTVASIARISLSKIL